MFLRSVARRVMPTASVARAMHVSRVTASSDGLRSILQEELQVEKEQGVPPTFSSEIRGFKVEYTPGCPTINLNNVVDGDLVNIRINLNDCDIPEAPFYQEEQEQEQEEEVRIDDEYDTVLLHDSQHLDERVQEETANYLASKGVGAELCRAIEGLVADAEYNEYLKWLNDTADFLE
ncbi:hypothetical protein PTSG_06396 [Salpingoeca rosetta]|uniref:Complement component 1 Q subcomponent-binding protein, mitochondrial n=1 Tax=Salpingoeca rosetta (strain ATCC 50818 / BSB-021) TaxID=946362 RepID=F2UCS9_SALR5|nr:uncharacterized protein PTSG_06396 [Salpingoeca rosetta]EGD74386.1 hypothetical protein PTSG_06396 [Salpingoeca rosetta]|eukprot:XP_004993286.1 hypothetical protein PTSG_06396 [Salpingoeca rosetta]